MKPATLGLYISVLDDPDAGCSEAGSWLEDCDEDAQLAEADGGVEWMLPRADDGQCMAHQDYADAMPPPHAQVKVAPWQARRKRLQFDPDAAFNESKLFAGAFPGWVFKLGPEGMGYYLDSPPPGGGDALGVDDPSLIALRYLVRWSGERRRGRLTLPQRPHPSGLFASGLWAQGSSLPSQGQAV